MRNSWENHVEIMGNHPGKPHKPRLRRGLGALRAPMCGFGWIISNELQMALP